MVRVANVERDRFSGLSQVGQEPRNVRIQTRVGGGRKLGGMPVQKRLRRAHMWRQPGLRLLLGRVQVRQGLLPQRTAMPTAGYEIENQYTRVFAKK